ncbi:DUF115 domain-containing protein [Geovibrio thiophilus]|uniref:DUF115 domain-containing protein n=1 Tax=Geovibrio thiophilus TaxID=139438 RepID=A0A3R5X1D9_9BACT|nr:6-hydroxymethylpterin diphosphokinase MptE-like protein [Geovibrio thiophilus]QAR32104.1 DUF115 domain-containing protein [Geovibrio thiophilus]
MTEYAVFGTGRAAENALRWADEAGYPIACIVDDFAEGEFRGFKIIGWAEFLKTQNRFAALITGRGQKGNIHNRSGVFIPVITASQLMPEGFDPARNTAGLLSLKDKHKGERCFIIGNGPSLTAEALGMLKDEVCFASNKIYLIYEQTKWRPAYYFVEDYLVAENCRDVINSLKCSKFFEYGVLEKLRTDEDTFAYGYADMLFSCDVVHGVAGGYSVTASQLQFAKYMGFKKVYFIGMDFCFTVPEGSTGAVIESAGERNHFHPDYRKKGEKWTFPELEKQKAFFDYVRENITGGDFRVYNASERTMLDSFPKVSLRALLKDIK